MSRFTYPIQKHTFGVGQIYQNELSNCSHTVSLAVYIHKSFRNGMNFKTKEIFFSSLLFLKI